MKEKIGSTRRDILKGAAALTAAALMTDMGIAKAAEDSNSDRVYLCNEDSNTLSVINPYTYTVEPSVNLTSFDEDHRPPFRLVTGGVVATHAAMIQKPLYRGAISIHGAVPSPDSGMIATTGRGSSNIYLIDTMTRSPIGNTRNSVRRDDVVPMRLTEGVFVGREPHEPTFSRTGKELWVTLRGGDHVAVLDVEKAIEESRGGVPGSAILARIPTLPGPAHLWFNKDGKTAILLSQKVSEIQVFRVGYDASGHSSAQPLRRIDISKADPFGFSPFLKLSPDGQEMWVSHKLADRIGVISANEEARHVDIIELGKMARPNHVEFIENSNGKAVYISHGRVDDNGPGGAASSMISIVDRSVRQGSRKVAASFFSGGREAHGLWVDPEGRRLFVAHEQDELPGTPLAGQTVCSVFNVEDPFDPKLVKRIPLGDHALPSGGLRNKKSINLVYVRPGARSVTA